MKTKYTNVMKSKILILLAVVLLAVPADAQNFLKSLGNTVKEKMKSEVKKEVNKKLQSLGNNSNEQQQQSQQQQQKQQSQQQQYKNRKYTPQQQKAMEQDLEMMRVMDEIQARESAKFGETSKPKGRPENDHSQYTQDNPPASPYSTISVCHKVLVADEGQNIVQQDGLDYIDEYGINHGGGILISGILWAPVNCGYHATKFPYGKLYQWGRKHGQGYGVPYLTDRGQVNPDELLVEIVPGPATPQEALKHPNRFYAHSDMALFNWTRNNMMLWNKSTDDGYISKTVEYDPCPEGWRLPEMQDFNILRLNYSEPTYKDGQKGNWCSGTVPYSTNAQRIFLPCAGYRDGDGKAGGREISGRYWSGRHGGGEALVWHLYVGDEVKVHSMAYPFEAYSVRCVKDIKGQRLR